jgi:hypothetical protein
VELGRRAGGEPVAGTRRRRARRRGGEDWGIRVGTSEDFLYVGLQFLMGYCWSWTENPVGRKRDGKRFRSRFSCPVSVRFHFHPEDLKTIDTNRGYKFVG